MSEVTKVKILRSTSLLLFASLFAITGSICVAGVLVKDLACLPLGVIQMLFTGAVTIWILSTKVD